MATDLAKKEPCYRFRRGDALSACRSQAGRTRAAPRPPCEAEDEATVDQASLTQVVVVREHSNAIRGGMELMGRLMQELDAVTTKGTPQRSTPPRAMKSGELQHIERSACRPGLR
jgi:hypothetical protein